MKVGLHQGSLLRPLLFTIVLEAFSRELRTRVHWEDLYASDLVIIADSHDMERSHGEAVEGRCRKDKDHDLWYSSGPPAEFMRIPMRWRHTGVGNNSIFSNEMQLAMSDTKS